jgi:hypothetical protein
VALTGEWINDMNSSTKDLAQSDEDILAFEVSDEALEVAASPTIGAAMSLPAAPTVSILVMCCGNESTR